MVAASRRRIFYLREDTKKYERGEKKQKTKKILDFFSPLPVDAKDHPERRATTTVFFLVVVVFSKRRRRAALFFFRSTYMREADFCALVKKATVCVCIDTCLCIPWGVSLLSRKRVKTLAEKVDHVFLTLFFLFFHIFTNKKTNKKHKIEVFLSPKRIRIKRENHRVRLRARQSRFERRRWWRRRRLCRRRRARDFGGRERREAFFSFFFFFFWNRKRETAKRFPIEDPHSLHSSTPGRTEDGDRRWHHLRSSARDTATSPPGCRRLPQPRWWCL